MSIKTKDDIMNSLKNVFGDNTSDEIIAIIEDVNDTLDDYNIRVGEDWKKKYEENDASWRKRYKERFYGGRETDKDDVIKEQTDDVEDDGKPKTYDELFKEREG